MTRCHKKFCFLAVICLFGLNLLLVFVSNQEKCMSLKGLQRWIRWPKTPKTRLLVIGQGRSGTSCVSKMLTIGEQVFEVYEPLRLIYRNSDNENKLQVLQAPLSCVLTPKTVWKLYERTCPTLLTCEPPLEQVEELGHKWMDLDENTFEWIKATTNLSNKREANKANFKSLDSLVRNSKANIEKWRIESPPERTNAIEKICKPLLLELIDEMSMSENVHWITEYISDPHF